MMTLEERTCVECRQVKLCDAMLAVCESCLRSVWLPALGIDPSPLTAEDKEWVQQITAEKANERMWQAVLGEDQP